MHTSQSNRDSKYLPFDEFHLAALTDIGPDHIRGAARRLVKDREDIKHNTVLNFICKQLGFRGGFAGFKKRYQSELKPFMAKNGLKDYGLSAHKCNDRPILIAQQQISDRIFHSERRLPSRVFVGEGVEWWDCLEAALNLSGLVVSDLSGIQFLKSSEEIKEARLFPPMHWCIQDGDHRLSLDKCFELNNLLGDQLLSFSCASHETREFVPQTYFTNDQTPDEIASEQTGLMGAAKILSKVISSMEQGWVDVIPFNEKLVFLWIALARRCIPRNGSSSCQSM